MDKISPEARSRTMRAIRSKDTGPEMLVRRFLHSRGYGYRVNVRGLPGTPDIALRRYRTVIFVHGCFWHGHDVCQQGRRPKTNAEFWRRKIERNRDRDQRDRDRLRALGWRTMVVWECQLAPKVRRQTLDEIAWRLDTALLDLCRAKKPKRYDVDFESTVAAAAEEHASYAKPACPADGTATQSAGNVQQNQTN